MRNVPGHGRAPIRSRGRRLPLLLLLMAAVPLTACLPIVSHGPAVVPGLGVTATAAAGMGGRFSPACEFSDTVDHLQYHVERTCPLQKRFDRGPLYVAVGRGWARESGWAYSARLHLPGPVDLYAQAPRKGGWNRGVGILLSPLQVSPYAQFGPAHGRWYSTQQIWLLNTLELERDYITPAFWWVPSLAWMPRLRHGEKPEGSRFRFHLVGGLGAERQRHRDDGERPLRPLWKLSAGLSIDLSRPAPDPPR